MPLSRSEWREGEGGERERRKDGKEGEGSRVDVKGMQASAAKGAYAEGN